MTEKNRFLAWMTPSTATPVTTEPDPAPTGESATSNDDTGTSGNVALAGAASNSGPAGVAARRLASRRNTLRNAARCLFVFAWIQIAGSVVAAFVVATMSDGDEHPYIGAGIAGGLAGVAFGVFMVVLALLAVYVVTRDEAELRR